MNLKVVCHYTVVYSSRIVFWHLRGRAAPVHVPGKHTDHWIGTATPSVSSRLLAAPLPTPRRAPACSCTAPRGAVPRSGGAAAAAAAAVLQPGCGWDGAAHRQPCPIVICPQLRRATPSRALAVHAYLAHIARLAHKVARHAAPPRLAGDAGAARHAGGAALLAPVRHAGSLLVPPPRPLRCRCHSTPCCAGRPCANSGAQYAARAAAQGVFVQLAAAEGVGSIQLVLSRSCFQVLPWLAPPARIACTSVSKYARAQQIKHTTRAHRHRSS